MPAKTVAQAFGPEIADQLARWAIDALVEPPEKIATFSTKLPADDIREGRAILERAGIDWRAIKRRADAGKREAEVVVAERRKERQIAENAERDARHQRLADAQERPQWGRGAT